MSKSRFGKFFVVPVFAGALGLSACAPQVDIHGYVPIASDVASIAFGI